MIITRNKRPDLVLLSRYNIRINFILLAVCCISIFISPHLRTIHFMEKWQGWRGEGAGRTYKQADTHGCMMNLSAYSPLKHTASLYHCLARSNTEDSEGAQGKREIQAFRRKAWKQAKKEMNTVLYMQMILNCQELRILMRIKHEREVSIQKIGKKTNFCT